MNGWRGEDGDDISTIPAVAVLGEALSLNHTLTSLTITYKVPDAGIVAIAEGLKVNKTLTHLNIKLHRSPDIYGKTVTCASAGTIAWGDMLRVNTTLTSLEESLDVAYMSWETVQHLMACLKDNKGLKSYKTNGIQAGWLPKPGGSYEAYPTPGLVGLVLDLINGNSTLTSLVLNSTRIKQDGAKELFTQLKGSTNTTLTTLGITDTAMSNRGSGSKAVITSLLEFLTANRTISTLDVESSDWSEGDIKTVTAYLAEHKIPTHVRMDGLDYNLGERKRYRS